MDLNNNTMFDKVLSIMVVLLLLIITFIIGVKVGTFRRIPIEPSALQDSFCGDEYCRKLIDEYKSKLKDENKS